MWSSIIYSFFFFDKASYIVFGIWILHMILIGLSRKLSTWWTLLKAGSNMRLVMETLFFCVMIIGILWVHYSGIRAEEWCSICRGLWLQSCVPLLMKGIGSSLGPGILYFRRPGITPLWIIKQLFTKWMKLGGCSLGMVCIPQGLHGKLWELQAA